MIIAIDDTYGQKAETPSQYVTHDRRTHVAVIFKDEEVQKMRVEIPSCLDMLSNILKTPIKEFHFSDIYNRRGAWKDCKDNINIKVIKSFAKIYSHYQWPILIQTIDDRTLADHKIQSLNIKIGKLDLTNREHLSLALLLFKLKNKYKSTSKCNQIIIDEGIGESGTDLGVNFFDGWPQPVSVNFQSSELEPILQIVDFIAFCINRSTHLALKKERSEIDMFFLDMVGSMNINSNDIVNAKLKPSFDISEFDEFHKDDRMKKGIE